MTGADGAGELGTALEASWIAQANARQRRGRAGRVQAGYARSPRTAHPSPGLTRAVCFRREMQCLLSSVHHGDVSAHVATPTARDPAAAAGADCSPGWGEKGLRGDVRVHQCSHGTALGATQVKGLGHSSVQALLGKVGLRQRGRFQSRCRNSRGPQVGWARCPAARQPAAGPRCRRAGDAAAAPRAGRPGAADGARPPRRQAASGSAHCQMVRSIHRSCRKADEPASLPFVAVGHPRAHSLIFGCILRCLDPILTVAAVLTARTVFVSPQDRLAESKAYGHAPAAPVHRRHDC